MVVMTAPRVWVGDFTDCPPRWEWDHEGWHYCIAAYAIEPGDIFAPGLKTDNPTVSPRDLDTLATCKVVDW